MIFSSIVDICVNVQAFVDDLVEANEMLQLQVTSGDPVILVVEPSVVEIIILNSDGEISNQNIILL